jgi:hypothetical protein
MKFTPILTDFRINGLETGEKLEERVLKFHSNSPSLNTSFILRSEKELTSNGTLKVVP